MSQFLSGLEILKAINSSITTPESKSIDLAVAYWGGGMAEKMNLSKTNADVRILCDLNSGFCDPGELKSLLDRPNIKIKSRNGLHSKVYLGSDKVVVGSANASSRGLTYLSDLEAAMSGTESVAAARAWFDRLWSDDDSFDVDKDTLKAIPPALPPLTFLTFLRCGPALFAELNLHFVVFFHRNQNRYTEQYDEMWEAIKALRPPVYSQAEIKMNGDNPFYIDDREAWTLPQHSFVISFWFYTDDPERGVEMGDVYSGKKTGRVNGKKVVFGQLLQDTNRLGFSFPPSERKALRELVDQYVRERIRTRKLDPNKHPFIEISADELAKVWRAQNSS